MVALSFKAQFAPPIVAGIKRQTVRAGRKRPPRAGERLQLYVGMRTKHCRKIIPDPICTEVSLIVIEVDAEHPFRLATSPARNFLNSTFTETPTSQAREGRPQVLIHPDAARALGIGDGAEVELGNRRGTVRLAARLFDGVRRDVLIAESIWPNRSFPDGRGINTLTGADPVAPYGGAAFHDNRVWIRRHAA